MPEDVCPTHVGPLEMAALESQLPENVSHEPGDVALMFLRDLLGNQRDPLTLMQERYSTITQTDSEPQFVPAHDCIVQNVMRPLKEAKHCYVMGMFIACIAQAGLVGEMVAIWRYRMLEPDIRDRLGDPKVQKIIKGKSFDRLGQSHRVEVLKHLDELSEETKRAFAELRNLRRKHLHYMVDKDSREANDARTALDYATILVVNTLGISIVDGTMILPPRVSRFIQEILKPPA